MALALEKLVIVGNIVNPESVCTDVYIVVEKGKITKIGPSEEFESNRSSGVFNDHEIITLSEDQFLMPGLVDCHTHAPQYPNLGLGLDKPLLEWLDTYTFPLEKKYANVDFAAQVYDKVVKRLILNGTTTACYFGTLHLEGTLELVKSAIRNGQRALVGKVSINEENPHGYYNDTDIELRDVEVFIKEVNSLKNDLVAPVVTPRFAISCDQKLMIGLASLAKKYNCRIQSHISENLKEVEFVLQKNSGCKSYSEVYDNCQILTDKCIMAHAVHLSVAEMNLLASRGVSVAHCPASNTRLASGLCRVHTLTSHGLTVGLGTDVSGGDNASMLDAMRRAMDVAAHLGDVITHHQALYMATLAGAKALNLSDKIGSLEVGKEFDALLIDVFVANGPITRFEGFPAMTSPRQRLEDLFKRFVYSGDDRNILQVYVKGVRVKDVV